MPDGPSNPYDILKGLETLRSVFTSPAGAVDSLPAAVARAGEVREAIDRLTEEVAALNRNVERALPVIESFEQQFGRVLPLVESIKRAERGIQRVVRRGTGGTHKAPGEEDSTSG